MVRISKSGKFQKGERFHPTKNEIIKIMKQKNSLILGDHDGRLYGFIDKKNELNIKMHDLQQTNDEQSTFMLWIFLPSHRKGAYKREKDKSMPEEVLLDGDDLVFPEQGDVITVYNINNDKIYGTITIESYPERGSKKKRSDSVIVTLQMV